MKNILNGKTIVLFIGKPISAHKVALEVIPFLSQLGCKPLIVMTEPPSLKKILPASIQRYQYYESQILRQTVYPCLDRFISTVGPRQDHREIKPGVAQIKPQRVLAETMRCTAEKNINDPQFIQRLSSDPTIIGGISIRNLQVFKKDIIEFFQSRGFFWNLHPGKLPFFQGVYSTLHAMLRGERELSWTLHDIDPGIDTGKIIGLTQPFESGQDKKISLLEVMDTLAYNGAMLLKDKIALYDLCGTADGITQDTTQQSYYSYPGQKEIEMCADNNIVLLPSLGKIIDIYLSCFAADNDNLQMQLRDALIQDIVPYEQQRIGEFTSPEEREILSTKAAA